MEINRIEQTTQTEYDKIAKGLRFREKLRTIGTPNSRAEIARTTTDQRALKLLAFDTEPKVLERVVENTRTPESVVAAVVQVILGSKNFDYKNVAIGIAKRSSTSYDTVAQLLKFEDQSVKNIVRDELISRRQIQRGDASSISTVNTRRFIIQLRQDNTNHALAAGD
jgi:hypothetical protein